MTVKPAHRQAKAKPAQSMDANCSISGTKWSECCNVNQGECCNVKRVVTESKASVVTESKASVVR